MSSRQLQKLSWKLFNDLFIWLSRWEFSRLGKALNTWNLRWHVRCRHPPSIFIVVDTLHHSFFKQIWDDGKISCGKAQHFNVINNIWVSPLILSQNWNCSYRFTMRLWSPSLTDLPHTFSGYQRKQLMFCHSVEIEKKKGKRNSIFSE